MATTKPATPEGKSAPVRETVAQIRKRSSLVAAFAPAKVEEAIFKALAATLPAIEADPRTAPVWLSKGYGGGAKMPFRR